MADFNSSHVYKAAVIGSGSGGLTAAIGLAGFDHEVVLIEGDRVGGDCTNVGCIPSKALLHAAEAGHEDPLAWARARRDQLHDEEDHEMVEHEQIVFVRGWGRLTPLDGDRGHHLVTVTGADGEIDVHAEHVIISTGSSPIRVELPGLPDDRLVTNEELFDRIDQVPGRLVLVGGGAISLEMATAFRDLGASVDIVELADRVLPDHDPEVSEAITNALTGRGITFHPGVSAESFDAATNTLQLSSGDTIADVDLVMSNVGRRPRLEQLDLDAAGVSRTRHGITVDSWGRTDVDGIWAIGDVTGATHTTHGANAIGRRTVRAIALPRVLATGQPRAMPSAIYSRPQVASVGMSVDDVHAIPERRRWRHRVDLADLDRGHTDVIEHGLLIVDAERFTGRIFRASIVGPAAADWIGIFTLAIDHGIGLRKIFGMVHPYPAHAEAVGRIADQFARDTYPNLAGEWWQMARGRASALRRR